MISAPSFPGVERIRGRALSTLVTFTCATGFLLFGYDQGVMSALIEEPMMASTMPQIARYQPNGKIGYEETAAMVQKNAGVTLQPSRFDSNVQGAVVSCYELGCLVGSIFVLFYGDKLGRRWCVFIGSIIMTIGTIIMVAHDTIGSFSAGRVIAGVGNGLNTATIPTLQSELSRPQYRGLLVFVEGALLAGGVMISYWLDFGFYFLRYNSVQWRFPIAFQIVFALVLLFGVMCMPESPRWLVKHDRVDEARTIIARVYNQPEDSEEVETEVSHLVDTIQNKERALGPFKYKELFQQGPMQNRYRVILGCGAQCMQQWTGINNLTYYANTVFKMVQAEDIPCRLLVCGSGILYFLAASAAIFMIDVFGRRNLMIWCACGMMICYAIISGMVKIVQEHTYDDAYKSYGQVAEAFIYLYFLPWSFGWLGMTWLYPPEITPIRIRAPASALSTCVNWIMNFTVVMISPPAFDNLKNHTFTMFGVFNFLFMPIVYCFYPETKRRGLEEMDLIFEDAYKEGFWRPSRFQTNAVYLSLTRPVMSAEELDNELAERKEEQKSLPVEEAEDHEAQAHTEFA